MNINKRALAGYIWVLLVSSIFGAAAFSHETPEGHVYNPAANPENAHASTDSAPEVHKEKSSRSGASLYSTCYYCHSLKPNFHLTGPSLAGLWGKKAGQVEGFELYSDELKKSELVWNEKTLAKWLSSPKKAVPGTTMPDVFIGEENIQKLVGFLKTALSKNGYEKVVKEKLISEKLAAGQLPKYSRVPDKTSQVKAIESCSQIYTIVFADGSTKKIWKFNLAFKLMQGDLAPKEDLPVLVPTGSMGDRFEVVFRSIKDLSTMITECKAK